MVAVAKTVVWDGAVVNALAEAFTTDVVMGALAGLMGGMLADVTIIAEAAVAVAWEFTIPAPLYNFSCCAMFACWPMALLNFVRVLQAWMPSYHV